MDYEQVLEYGYGGELLDVDHNPLDLLIAEEED